jgi:hypothetical protein
LAAQEFRDFGIVLELVLADRLEARPARARYRRRDYHPGFPQDAGHKARLRRHTAICFAREALVDVPA